MLLRLHSRFPFKVFHWTMISCASVRCLNKGADIDSSPLFSVDRSPIRISRDLSFQPTLNIMFIRNGRQKRSKQVAGTVETYNNGITFLKRSPSTFQRFLEVIYKERNRPILPFLFIPINFMIKNMLFRCTNLFTCRSHISKIPEKHSHH